MRAEVEKYRMGGTAGWKIMVKLLMEGDDQLIIIQNAMIAEQDVDIFRSKDGATVLPFSRFYGGTHFTILDIENELRLSAKQGDMVVAGLRAGFVQCNKFIIENRLRSQPHLPIPEPPQPFSISLLPRALLKEHSDIIGASGGGKSQLIQTLALHLALLPDPPIVVLMDSKTSDPERHTIPLLKQKFPNAIHIDPATTPMSLDLFNPAHATDGLDQLQGTFKFMFEAGSPPQPLTGRQTTVFNRGLALMILGFPAAHGRTANITDFEEFFRGAPRTKGQPRQLTPRMWKAVKTLEKERQEWYKTQYGDFAENCDEVLQRLENLCGLDSRLRPLLKAENPLDLRTAITSGSMILLNTNDQKLGTQGSQFLGRFLLKLLETQMQQRDSRSRDLVLIIDEAPEYFASADMFARFLRQARQRNICCIFAHQSISQLQPPDLRDAITSVAALLGTNIERADRGAAMKLFQAKSVDEIEAHQRDDPDKPKYADYILLRRRDKTPTSFRLKFYQLRDYQPPVVAAAPSPSPPSPPPLNDNEPDARKGPRPDAE